MNRPHDVPTTRRVSMTEAEPSSYRAQNEGWAIENREEPPSPAATRAACNITPTERRWEMEMTDAVGEAGLGPEPLVVLWCGMSGRQKGVGRPGKKGSVRLDEHLASKCPGKLTRQAERSNSTLGAGHSSERQQADEAHAADTEAASTWGTPSIACLAFRGFDGLTQVNLRAPFQEDLTSVGMLY
ncbi:hypothetical protein CHU98_g2957 [Xylaria longipes]|nr:hypothetical protein CHU98_g2957 [Xylaria longipes]